MRPETQGAVLVAVAVMVANLALNGGHTSYVKLGLRFPLLAAALFVAVIGAIAVARSGRTNRDDDGHGHGVAATRIGLILLVPVIAVYLIAPAPLGSFAASRGGQNQLISGTQARGLGPLPGAEVDGAVEATFWDLILRVYYEPEQVEDVTVRLIGFVAPETDIPGAYRLTRFQIACCASDASALQVIITGVPDIPETDQWMKVDATWTGEVVHLEGTAKIPILQFVAHVPTTQPAEPYET
ncbi:MAG: TIGR03943 family protein [Acidimicrobiia bacterium]